MGMEETQERMERARQGWEDAICVAPKQLAPRGEQEPHASTGTTPPRPLASSHRSGSQEGAQPNMGGTAREASKEQMARQSLRVSSLRSVGSQGALHKQARLGSMDRAAQAAVAAMSSTATEREGEEEAGAREVVVARGAPLANAARTISAS